MKKLFSSSSFNYFIRTWRWEMKEKMRDGMEAGSNSVSFSVVIFITEKQYQKISKISIAKFFIFELTVATLSLCKSQVVQY